MEIALVGVDIRFPGARDVRTFWTNLMGGVESIRRFSAADLLKSGVDPALIERLDYVPAAGSIGEIEDFDAEFFGYTQREASLIDPQQRIFLECCWGALENAGYAQSQFAGSIGVFGGVGPNTYLLENAHGSRGEAEDLFLEFISNDKDFVTTRVSYKLNLKGPSINIQTACSTSLVAVHLACQSLRLGETDLALAGGSSLRVPETQGYLFQKDGIDSSDGHCRPFDVHANGTVFSSGAGVVTLRRVEDAVADGDHIYAIIKGSAINNDGAGKVGYTAPGFSGQSAVIAEALAMADIPAESIAFLEAHGTGTALGDAVEVQALSRAFSRLTRRRSFCALGSVKANLGHMDTAAGLAGLIKAALVLKHRMVPPMPGVTAPNPELRLEDSAFYINEGPMPLERGTEPLRAGISSFGIGGTNAHIVLEEAPALSVAPHAREAQLLPMSARTAGARSAVTTRLADTLALEGGLDLADVAYTLGLGREHLPHRAFVVAKSTKAAAALLAEESKLETSEGKRPPKLCFLFPGQGSQFVGMGQELYRSEPAFTESLGRSAAVLNPILGLDLISVLFPKSGDGARERELLSQTRITQPALAAVEFAVAAWLASCGIKPDLVLGHSIGEYVAASLAGVFPVEDCLRIVAARGALMQALAPGMMVAVRATEESVRRWIGPGVALAAVNTPEECVISGEADAVDQVCRLLSAEGLLWTRLEISHAFHSPMMEPILVPFEAELRRARPKPPALPVISNLTGQPLSADEAVDPRYWLEHLQHVVRFSACLETALAQPDVVLLEAGPGGRLCGMARKQPGFRDTHTLLSTIPQGGRESAASHALNTLGRLWLAGRELDWRGLFAGQRRGRVPLPAYPFQRRRCWIDRCEPRRVERKPEPAEDVYVPSWVRQEPAARAETAKLEGKWLVSGERSDIASRFALKVGRGTERMGVIYAGDGAICELSGLLRELEEAATSPRYLAVITDCLFDVTGEEPTIPERALLSGFLRSLVQEWPHMRCLLVDAGSAAVAQDGFVDRVVADLTGSKVAPVLAYRGSETWVPSFVAAPHRAARKPVRGAYLITGGMGRIGFEAARALVELAEGAPVRLYLTSRSHATSQRVEELRRGGADIECRATDVSDPVAMRALVSEIVERHGRLAGVIHAAGTLDANGFAPVTGITPEILQVHWPAKVAGLRSLADAVGGLDIDFCVVCSSLSSVLGGKGYGAYAAANAFIDSFCGQMAQKEGLPWLSVDWDAWDFGPEAGSPALGPSGFMPARGRELLKQVLGMRGVVVCAEDLHARYERWCASAWTCGGAGVPASRDENLPHRERLAQIWKRVLGTAGVSDDDEFFALGGSSLMALQILSFLRREMSVDLSLKQFLEHSSFGALCRLLDADGKIRSDAEIPRVDRAGAHPLSLQQQALWLAEAVDSGARGAFHVCDALLVEGPLDVAALESSFRALVERHEILRMGFGAEDGTPRQVIGIRTDFDFRSRKLDSADGFIEAVERVAEREFSMPFDLEHGPLLRIQVLEQSPQRHVLLIIMHHILVDDWSLGILRRELSDVYCATIEGREPSLAPLPTQYVDYAAWQRDPSTEELRRTAGDYWTEKLRGAPSGPPVPTDHVRAGMRTYRGGQQRFHLSVNQIDRVREVADQSSSTPFMVLLTIFECLLHGLSGSDDFVIGTPMAGRKAPNLEAVVGYFVNAVPLRVQIPAEIRFRDLLAQCRELVLEAFAHEDVLPGRSPLDVWFTLLTHGAEGTLAPGVNLKRLPIGSRPARFDLALILEPQGNGLTGTLEYSKDLFEDATGKRMADAFLHMLELALADPEMLVTDLRSRLEQFQRDSLGRESEAAERHKRASFASARRQAQTA